eukprot:XP_001704580.1 Hypothetical protein GL50803_4397 [Giardia lamblia ATCC 50803]
MVPILYVIIMEAVKDLSSEIVRILTVVHADCQV